MLQNTQELKNISMRYSKSEFVNYYFFLLSESFLEVGNENPYSPECTVA